MSLQYILDRLTEASTWRGIILMATAVGINISPDMQTAIVSAGLAVAGLVGIITKDIAAKKTTAETTK